MELVSLHSAPQALRKLGMQKADHPAVNWVDEVDRFPLLASGQLRFGSGITNGAKRVKHLA